MRTVAEIKRAIEKLSPQERCELEALLHPWPEDDWDRQMQADAEPGGKLHEMMSASRKDAQGGKLMDNPPAKVRIIRRKGRHPVGDIGRPITEEEIKAALAEFP